MVDQLASTSSAQLAYLEESVYGTVGSGTPAKLRMTGEDLAFNVTMLESKEINASRRTPDSVIVDADASGGINLELSYHEYDPFLEALMCSTFDTFGTGGVKSMTVSFNAVAGTITDDGVDGFAGIEAKQFVAVLSPAGHAGVYLVASRTDDQLTVDASTPLASTQAGVSVTVSSTRLAQGSAALRSFSIEQAFTDVAQYFMHTGRIPGKLELNFAIGAAVTGKLDFIGRTCTRADATQFAFAAGAAQAYGIMNVVTNLGALMIRDASLNDLIPGSYVQGMKLSIDGALRGQKALMTLGNAGVGTGRFKIDGSVQIYLKTGDLYDEALAGNKISLRFATYDAAYNGYGFSLPNCKLGIPKVNAGAMDSDVLLDVPFTAVSPDTTNDVPLYIDRYGEAVDAET